MSGQPLRSLQASSDDMHTDPLIEVLEVVGQRRGVSHGVPNGFPVLGGGLVAVWL